MLDHFSITVSDYAATGTDDGPLSACATIILPITAHPVRDPDGDKVEAVCHSPGVAKAKKS